MNPVAQDSTVATMNPLKELLKYGQSVWLDYIRRNLLTSGELKRHLDEDGLRGMTSNPAIFEKADGPRAGIGAGRRQGSRREGTL